MNVIDASVAVKWFSEEPFSAEARQLLEEDKGSLVFPDVFVIEVAATLVRIANVNKASREDSQAALLRLLDLMDSGAILRLETPPKHTIAAAALAIDLGHPLKDCIYLALAMELGCDLVTYDARFAARAKEVWAGVRLLGI